MVADSSSFFISFLDRSGHIIFFVNEGGWAPAAWHPPLLDSTVLHRGTVREKQTERDYTDKGRWNAQQGLDCPLRRIVALL